MKTLYCLLFSILCYQTIFCQKHDRKLQKKLEAMVKDFNGQVGIYVHNLKKNRVAYINEDTLFTTASMVKIPILVGLADKLHRGELKYNQELIYRDSLYYAGVDILGSFKDSQKIELGKVMMLMLTMSDNTASLWLQGLAGGGARINEVLDSLGFVNTRVNSRTAGREENRTRYGWGQTTPKEMATLMEKIANREVISKSASEKMLRVLGRNWWDENAISSVPPDVFVASKHGSLNPNRNEVLYVHGGKSRYVFCICTQNNKDIRWTPDNEAWVLTKNISYLLWKHFNLSSKWKPTGSW
jgi:beta-lactamase class A